MRRLFLLDVVVTEEVELVRDAVVVRGELVGDDVLGVCSESSLRRVCGVLPGPPEGDGVVRVDTGPLALACGVGPLLVVRPEMWIKYFCGHSLQSFYLYFDFDSLC